MSKDYFCQLKVGQSLSPLSRAAASALVGNLIVVMV